jgi:hypothetical protein
MAPWVRDVIKWMEIKRNSPLFCDGSNASEDTTVNYSALVQANADE